MKINDLLSMLGNPGRYAMVMFIFFTLNYFPVSFNHLAMSVFGAAPPHRCKVPEGVEVSNLTFPLTEAGKLDSCSVYSNYSHESNSSEPCQDGWEFSPIITEIPGAPNESTLVNEWSLVCGDKWLVSTSTSVYFAGVMIGGILFGTMSDVFGRRPVLVFCLFMPVVLGIMLFFVENFVLFIIIRFLIGILMQGLQTSTYVLGMEQFYDHKHRAYTTALFECGWACGVMLLALYAWVLKSWRWIQLAFSVSTLLSIFYMWSIPESLRWLYTKGKYHRAQNYLKTASKFNKVTLDDRYLNDLQSVAEEEKKNDPDYMLNHAPRKYSILDMFRTTNLRVRSIVMFYVWFATACSYYGLSLNASRLAGNRYLNYFINGAIEFPAYLSGVWILSRFGRRIPLTVYFIVGGVALIVAGTMPKSMPDGQDISWVATLLAWVGKFSTAGCWSVIFLYASEIYPTVIRNVGVGACAFWARVGSLVAPQILLIGDYYKPWVSTVILGGIAVIGGFATLMLPETMGMMLPDTVEQAENLQALEEEGDEEGDKYNGVNKYSNGGYIPDKPGSGGLVDENELSQVDTPL